MNASYRLNTCKSRGSRVAIPLTTGARVSNAYPTFRLLLNNLLKGRLMQDSIMRIHVHMIKDLSVTDGDAFH